MTIVTTTLHTQDGVDLAASVRTPPDPIGAVILAHGFSGGKDQPEVVATADVLVARGYAVVCYDARGHGASGGECTLGETERFDVAAAVELAGETAERTAVVGASMGGIAVLRYAVGDPSLAAVVTVSTPAVWQVPRTARGAFSVVLTQTAAGRWVSRRKLAVRLCRSQSRGEAPIELAARLARPLAVIHGSADRFVRAGQARLLHSAAGAASRLTLVPGMGHAYQAHVLLPLHDALEWGFSQPRELVTA
jgi:alpha-beta hydrolase superfamily lysophospholipase